MSLSLSKQIEKLLPQVLTSAPINGPELMERLRAAGAPDAADSSYRYHFTQLSKSRESSLRRVPGGGKGYYFETSEDVESALRAEIARLRAALADIAALAQALSHGIKIR